MIKYHFGMAFLIEYEIVGITINET